MKEEKTIIARLESEQIPLSPERKERLWNAIEADIKAVPIRSPFLFNYIHTKSMTPFIIALTLMAGMGGTAFASNDARPGDVLFSVDRALEEARLALAQNDESRARLQIVFAEERLAELRSILAESEPRTDSTSSTTTGFEAEADVFTNTTIVTVEVNDRKTTYETSADTRAEVIDEIVQRFSVERSTVEHVLDFEIEDRASRVDDVTKKTFSRNTDTRVTTAIQLIDESLSDSRVNDIERSRFVSSLLSEFSENADRVRIDDDKIEIRNGHERIEIREKAGQTEIRMKGDDDYDEDDSNDRSGDSFEAEADVFTNTTIVTVEVNDRKTTYETSADTRAEVIDEIVQRFSVERSTVEHVLDFEIEDRASRVDDSSRDDDSSDTSRSSSDDSSDSPDDSDNRIRIEVRVEDGVAEVRMEHNGERDEFEISYSSKSELITQLSNRSGLSESQVSDNLDLEVRE